MKRATKKRMTVDDLMHKDAALPYHGDDVVFYDMGPRDGLLAVSVAHEAARRGMWPISGYHRHTELPMKYHEGHGWWVPQWALPLKPPRHISENLTPHERDMRIIGWALSKEAEDREWCDEFESFLRRVNPLLSAPLRGRRMPRA